MIFAIDFDGTITANHGMFLRMCMALNRGFGDEVMILTSGAAEYPPEQREAVIEGRLKHLKMHRNNHFSRIVCVEKGTKGEWCLRHGVEVFIDDEEGNVAEVSRISPSTICLHFLAHQWKAPLR